MGNGRIPRRLVLALLAIGLLGLGTELVLLRHYEAGFQLVPLTLIAAALLVIGWHAVTGSAASVRVLQVLMTMFLLAGAVGVMLHFRANVEFQTELDPSQGRWALFMNAIHAKVPPALAPGAMAQLGLLGLLFAFRHPALTDDPGSTL